MNRLKLLKQDLRVVRDRFPKLIYGEHNSLQFLKGELDICDIKGAYWDTFQIVILIPKDYPHGVPVLIELEEKIPRCDDRHVSEEGICCVDIVHELIYRAGKGIRLPWFIGEKVYPFLANQIYFENDVGYAGEEYAHHFQGIQQFYKEKLKLQNPVLASKIIESVLKRILPERNDPCVCGSGKKYKACHIDAGDFLKAMPEERLTSDLKGFKELLVEAQS